MEIRISERPRIHSIRQLAALLGYDYSYLCKVLRGEVRPGLRLVEALAKFFGVPVDKMLEWIRNGVLYRRVYGEQPEVIQKENRNETSKVRLVL